MKKEVFDVEGVMRAFLNMQIPDHAAIVSSLSHAMRESDPVKMVIGHIGMHAVEAKKQPIETIGIALMYGMLMGIELERAKKRIV
jgi:hypothetical protein